jgi:hypothetical protein
MRKGMMSAGRSWRKQVDRSGSVGAIVFGMLLEGLTRSWELASWFRREGVAGSVGSLWRSVCIETEEGKLCWLRVKGNRETMEVSL